MAVVEELLRSESNGNISFGNHDLAAKAKLEDYEHAGDLYKVKTFQAMTKLEKNGLFLYESVTKHFCDVISEIIEENNIDLKVDYNASCNPVGLVRLPFTYNTISQTFVQVEFYEDGVYNINDLIDTDTDAGEEQGEDE